MDASYRFFENHACKYFPCHKGFENGEPFNCLFCYCPFYLKEKCPGNPTFWDRGGGKIIKDCTNCTYPHQPASYDVIIKWLIQENNKRVYSEEIVKKAVPLKKELKGQSEGIAKH